MDIVPYTGVLEATKVGRTHLLLGNGFSIACDPIFSYSSLYERALAKGLSPRACTIFDRLGTNNFEGAMRLLDDAHWAARVYGLVQGDTSAFQDDLSVIKATLIEVLAESHLEHPGMIADARKQTALSFLSHYHCVFCTNYDLLPYWVNMLGLPHPAFGDGFRAEAEVSESGPLVFTEHLGGGKGLFFLHGALHLYMGVGGLLKHSWSRENRRLIELVRDGLAAGQYPLFVAEGSPEKKLGQIRQNAYLSYCMGKLGRVEGRLVTFGHSLGPSDAHILDAIASNLKLTEIFLGTFGGTDSVAASAMEHVADRIVARRRQLQGDKRHAKECTITLFDSSTVAPWG